MEEVQAYCYTYLFAKAVENIVRRPGRYTLRSGREGASWPCRVSRAPRLRRTPPDECSQDGFEVYRIRAIDAPL